MVQSKNRPGSEDKSGPSITAGMSAIAPIVPAAWLDIMTDSAQFIAQRLEQDLETQQALLACKTPADLMKIQSDFHQKALKQYIAQATRMFELMSNAATTSLKDASVGKSRGYDDVPL